MSIETVTTEGFTPDVRWEPFINGPCVGYKVTRLSDGAVTYLYMNPSWAGEGKPDVFVYTGPNNDPAIDPSMCYLTPAFRITPNEDTPS